MNSIKLIAYLPLMVLMTGIIGCSKPEQNMTAPQSQVPDSPDLVRPLLPGMKAVSFDLQAADGSRVSFDPDNMDKPVILSFYRGGWCPYCNRQLADFRKIETELKEMGYDLMFISADKYDVIKESLKIGDVDYTLLSDNDLVTARSYGLAFRVNDEMVEKYLEFDIDLEAASGRKHHWLPIPASFVIGKDGVIRFQYANPNYKVRVPGELLLTAARLALNEDA